MKKLTLLLAFTLGVTFLASAQTTPKVKKTQVKQSVRIAQGVHSGELTRREARQVKHQQRHIQHEKRIAKSDGVVTSREKANIRHDQRVANRTIYHQKHDNQSRF